MRNKNKKKILLVGSNEFFSLERMYLRAFKKANCNVKIFHIYNINKNLFFRFIWKYFKFLYFYQQRQKLQKYIKKNVNKYDLIIIFKGLYLNKKFIIDLKKICYSSKFVNIYPDNPFDRNYFNDISNNNLFKALKYFDYFFTYSKKIQKKLKLILPTNKIIYLPFAHDPAIHIRQKLFHKHLYDISFIGTADKERFNIIRQLKDYKIVIGGNGWDRYKQLKNVVYLGAINTQLSATVIRKSTVSLNLLRKQNYGSHNMRTFEIPSMNGLMLTTRSYEQNKFFPENRASFMFGNTQELNEKIEYIFSHPEKAKLIRRKGLSLVKKHNYMERLKCLIKLVNEYKKINKF